MCNNKKEEKERKLASATVAENRAMSQMIFKPNKYSITSNNNYNHNY